MSIRRYDGYGLEPGGFICVFDRSEKRLCRDREAAVCTYKEAAIGLQRFLIATRADGNAAFRQAHAVPPGLR